MSKLYLDESDGECSICANEKAKLISPKGYYKKDPCNHKACRSCWKEIGERKPECPICRRELTKWMIKVLGVKINTKERYDIPDELAPWALNNSHIGLCFCEECNSRLLSRVLDRLGSANSQVTSDIGTEVNSVTSVPISLMDSYEYGEIRGDRFYCKCGLDVTLPYIHKHVNSGKHRIQMRRKGM